MYGTLEEVGVITGVLEDVGVLSGELVEIDSIYGSCEMLRYSVD